MSTQIQTCCERTTNYATQGAGVFAGEIQQARRGSVERDLDLCAAGVLLLRHVRVLLESQTINLRKESAIVDLGIACEVTSMPLCCTSV